MPKVLSETPERSRSVLLTCSCDCGAEFTRRKRELNASGLHYVSSKHAGAHKTRVYLEEMCGPLFGLALEYLNGSAKQHYKTLKNVRASIGPFLLFLNERGITDLEVVNPKLITEFFDWAEDVEYSTAAHNISMLKGFLAWANRHGYRHSPCPIYPKFHGKKRPIHLPRPYSQEEVAFIWRLASGRGSKMVCAALAIGQESGLRLGEICNLRVQDVDLDGLRLFVRLPNKTNTERWALFTDRAAHYLADWLGTRDANFDHDYLFHNKLGGPPSPEVMHAEFCRTFCKVYDGRVLHDDGVEHWSTHRLRHTMASNLASGGASVTTIMKAGGWKTASAMLLYTKADPELARRGYDEAMARAEEQERSPLNRVVISPDAFLAEYGDGFTTLPSHNQDS